MYDYLIVGAGLSGAIFAHEANKRGKKVKVIDKRDHIGGNIYCQSVEGINVHKYGAHIFHTSNKKVWDYVNQFAEFNNYINSPIANYQGHLYNLPFNMNTFYALWGTKTPQEVKDKIAEQTTHMQDVEPKNLEEQAIKLIGTDVYEKLIKGYTEKQWGRSATELPPFIIKRYQFDCLMTIIISTTVTKGFQLVVTMSSSKSCWKESKQSSIQISLQIVRTWRLQQLRLSSQG